MTIKSGCIDQFAAYSKFISLKEFNQHMEMWMVGSKQHFTKSELIGLKRLVRFSAKIPGVCNAKIGTLLKAINEDYHNNGISRSTFKRMIQKANRFGILTIYETARKNGSQSSNLYLFNRFPTNEPPNSEKLTHLNKTNNPSKTIYKNKSTKRIEEPYLKEESMSSLNPKEQLPHHSDYPKEKTMTLDSTYTSDRVPKPFVSLVKCFYNQAKIIEDYWRMTQIAAYRNNCEKETDNVLDIAITSFKQLISKIKSTRQSLRNPIAYYYGILNNKFEEHYFQDLLDIGFGNQGGIKGTVLVMPSPRNQGDGSRDAFSSESRGRFS